MIDYLLKKYRQYKCDHGTVHTEEYAHMGFDTYTGENGPYRPFFEGEENKCVDCGKVWFTNQTGFRYYVDQEGELTEKVKREP